MPFNIKRHGQVVASNEKFEHTVSTARKLLDIVGSEQSATYAIFSEDDKLLAAITNCRITGTFTKQVWGGHNNDDAIFVGDVEFDATDYVLRMSLADVLELKDNDQTSDEVGSRHVDWDGPHYVSLTYSVCEYFGVSRIKDITAEALAFACNDAKPAAAQEQTLTVTLQLKVQVAPGADIEAFHKDIEYTVRSTTPGVTIVGRPEIVPAN